MCLLHVHDAISLLYKRERKHISTITWGEEVFLYFLSLYKRFCFNYALIYHSSLWVSEIEVNRDFRRFYLSLAVIWRLGKCKCKCSKVPCWFEVHHGQLHNFLSVTVNYRCFFVADFQCEGNNSWRNWVSLDMRPILRKRKRSTSDSFTYCTYICMCCGFHTFNYWQRCRSMEGNMVAFVRCSTDVTSVVLTWTIPYNINIFNRDDNQNDIIAASLSDYGNVWNAHR